LQGFPSELVDAFGRHPGIAAGLIAAVVLAMLVKAVIDSSHRYR
jgi:hypothetical protein